MNEKFLSYLWKSRCFHTDLHTESGEELAIHHPGEQNTDSGPDFFNSRLRIGNTQWAGNIEIHVCSSDWYRHGHHNDPAFNNAILHVVFENDKQVYRNDGTELPTLVVKNHFPGQILDRYQKIMSAMHPIPCMTQLHEIPQSCLRLWAPALTLERWMFRSENLNRFWEKSGNDWEETIYQHIASCFGFKINQLAFELLARSAPLKLIRAVCVSQKNTEALLFGQAGFFAGTLEEEYPLELFHIYQLLKNKYTLQPLQPGLWKFLRLHPLNFPTIRISQFADLITKINANFFRILEPRTLSGFIDLFQISASGYWNSHYLFDRPSSASPKKIGPAGKESLIINGVLPMLFFYGTMKDRCDLRELTFELLEQMPPERIALIQIWKNAGIIAQNALESQALLQLKSHYCDKKRCLECRFGKEILVGSSKSLKNP